MIQKTKKQKDVIDELSNGIRSLIVSKAAIEMSLTDGRNYPLNRAISQLEDAIHDAIQVRDYMESI